MTFTVETMKLRVRRERKASADPKIEVARKLAQQRRFQRKHEKYEGSNNAGGSGDLGHGFGA